MTGATVWKRAYVCKRCGGQFESSQGRASYCSRSCLSLARREQLKGKRRVERTIGSCEYCSTSFEIGHRGGSQRRTGTVQRFCSRSCASRHASIARTISAAEKKAEMAALRNQQADLRQREAVERRRQRAAEATIELIARRAQMPSISCSWCGKSFVVIRKYNRARVCCSPECGARRESAFGNARKRARIFGVAYEPVSPRVVFAKDGWTCHICGEPTDPSLMGTNADLAPTLDHVIALSRGGPHTYDNVRCAHRICNSRKSDRVVWTNLPLPTGQGRGRMGYGV